MSKRPIRQLSRRTVLTTTGLVGLGALSLPVVAAPPKGVDPADPDTEITPVLRKLDGMTKTISKVQTRLQSKDGCDQVCGTVLEHTFLRASLTNEAKALSTDREWAAARANVEEVKGIVEGDIALLESVEDRGSIGDVLGLERALLNQTVSTLGVMPGDNVS